MAAKPAHAKFHFPRFTLSFPLNRLQDQFKLFKPSRQMAADDQGASLDWETHKTRIRNLFISQNKTWKEVAAIMSEEHQFTATYATHSFRCTPPPRS